MNKFIAVNPIWLIITLLVFSALVKLGMWQSARAVEKEQRIARIETLKTSKAFSIEAIQNLIKESGGLEEVNDLPVNVIGKLQSEPIFLLDNQMLDGQFGYRVFQLVSLKQGELLLNLGWLAGDRTRQTKPDVKSLSGEISLTGNVRVIEQGIVLAEENYDAGNKQILVQQIDIEKIAKFTGKTLLPFVVYLDESANLGYKKSWQPIVMPPEKHRGYAFQWFSLATAWLLLMIWAARKARIKT